MNVCPCHLFVRTPRALQGHIKDGATVKALPVEEQSHFLRGSFCFLFAKRTNMLNLTSPLFQSFGSWP